MIRQKLEQLRQFQTTIHFAKGYRMPNTGFWQKSNLTSSIQHPVSSTAKIPWFEA